MQWLKRLFPRVPAAASAPSLENLPSVPMRWREAVTLPIPDWHAMREEAPTAQGPTALHMHYTSAAHAWLDTLGEALGGTFAVTASANFMLLSDLDSRARSLTLQHCERTRKRILAGLPGVADSRGFGPHVAMVFADHDQYYNYVGNYYPERGEFAMSSGMFVQHGYGHFVFVAEDLSKMEPVIAHELTHCLVTHLPLPAWLNEGIAVNTEKRLTPDWHRPGQGLYTEKELARKRAAFWNESTIQQFWSGKSFRRPDDGNLLSYDLGERLTRLAAADYAMFSAFANAALRRDSGAAACEKHLGVSLGDLAAAVLGAGDWRPDPESWREGIEVGQFEQ